MHNTSLKFYGTTQINFATSSFGMGVDCSYVRQILHVCIPDDKDAYIQGKCSAGRDEKPAFPQQLEHRRRNEILEYLNNKQLR